MTSRAQSDKALASTAYTYLGVTSSAHIYGLGGHNITTVDDDIQLIEQNPALLGPEMDKQIGLNYMRYMGSMNFMGARYGMKIRDHNAWAAGIQYFGYGKMTATDIDGTIIDTFSASDIAFTGTYSHDINSHFRGGITVKVLSSQYESYSALALGVDLGLSYYDDNTDFAFGVVLKNLGGQVKRFYQTYEPLPWDVQLGLTKGLGSTPIRLSITFTDLTKWNLPYYTYDSGSDSKTLVEKNTFFTNLLRHITFGAEWSPNGRLFVALGYNHRTRTDMSTYNRNFLSGFSLGAGLKVRGFGFSVAIAQPHNAATTFMLNLNTNLAELLNR